jgi:TPR repeat protein
MYNGGGVSIDFNGAAYYLKLAADQGNVDTQFNYGICLQKGEGVSIDFNGAARYLKLAADEGDAESQHLSGIWLLTEHDGHRNIADSIRYLKLSTENDSSNGQFVVTLMAENGIRAFPSINFDTAVRYYERCSDLFPAASACFGRCLETGLGIPVDFTVAAEFFKKAADSDDANGMNSFGCCLERGQGVDPDIDWAV